MCSHSTSNFSIFVLSHVKKCQVSVIYYMEIGLKKGELFQFARWLNLAVGFLNLYYYSIGGGYHLLGIGALNIGVWVFSRHKKVSL